MKRIFCLIMVFISVFAMASCSKKKSHDYEERVSKKISADDGGTVESSDGKTSVEVPAGALDEDTKITMTIYDASGYSEENGKIVSKVIEFEPSGTIFKKPVIITMTAGEDVKEKTISAAVYNEAEDKWSYSQGFYLILDGKNEAGDPIMKTTDDKEIALDNGNLTTAAGDPIMMTNAAGDPIMTNAAGDPIMMSAAGDPIMLASENAAGDPIMTSAAGDPIMTSAAGDPIMNAAAGDPIMMTTGHFTTFTFIAFDPREAAEIPDDSDNDADISDDEDSGISEEDDDEPVNDEDEIPDEVEDEDIVPEPEKVYSKVICTGKTICNDEEYQILCPKEGEDFYGQDAQYAARKGCIPHSYTTLPKPEDYNETDYIDQVHDNVTGLTWIIDIRERRLSYMNQTEDPCGEEYSEYSYLGSGWRLPTTKEVMTLTDHSILYDALIDQTYFTYLRNIWTAERFIYQIDEGLVFEPNDSEMPLMWCVRGEEYGKVNEDNYEVSGEGNEKVVFDSSTDLFWQKEYAENKTWKDALSYCENLEYAEFDDWRLPNKNELITLLDLSKEEEPFSSFPDMPADGFWSSTAYDYYDSYNNVLSDGYAWMVYFKGGVVSYIPLYIDEEHVEYYPFQTEPGNAVLSVRCVRSDLTEKTEIPDCDETGIAPCRDANGTVWSSVLYPEIYADWPESFRSGSTIANFILAEMCRYMDESGSNKWRLPTIDEIRSIVTTDKLKTGGSCGVTAACSEESCFSEDDCTGDYSSQTLLYDYGIMVSGTLYDNIDMWDVWAVNVEAGFLDKADYELYVSELVQRCVLDETLPDYKKTPWLDPETGLLWSDISPDWDHVTPAQEYCPALSQTDHEHWWRMPTLSELETLINEPEEEYAGYDLSGRYSVFGDISPLISSDYINDGSYYFIDFSNLTTDHDKDGWGRIRCVSEGPGPCAGNPCAGIEHAADCVPDSAEEYHCNCFEGHDWIEGECREPQS